jgi:bisphosphoglycerate-dependent phosphoglycerate mutase
LLKEAGFTFDKAYTSLLRRAIKTCWLVLEEASPRAVRSVESSRVESNHITTIVWSVAVAWLCQRLLLTYRPLPSHPPTHQMDLMWIPMAKAWQLNERHYGALQGLDKSETVAKHGKDKVHVWRRSYDIPPPALEKNSPHYPGNDVRYGSLLQKETPVTESLKTTLDRVMPFWQNHMLKDVLAGQNLLVAAHGNSLRALVKKLDDIPDDVITDLNIPTGACLPCGRTAPAVDVVDGWEAGLSLCQCVSLSARLLLR